MCSKLITTTCTYVYVCLLDQASAKLCCFVMHGSQGTSEDKIRNCDKCPAW